MDSAGMMMYMGKNYTGGPQFLSGLEDANITNPSEKDALCYDATNEVWINKSGVLREIVQKTQAQYDALTSEEKHDPTKIYEITDAQTISADIDDSSVSVGKTWSSSKINQINKEYVEITTVAGDTNATGLGKLFSAVDFSKITYKSVIYIDGTIFRIDSGTINDASTSLAMSSVPILNSTSVAIDRVLFRSASPLYYRATVKSSPAYTFNDYSSQSVGAGVKFRFYY